VGKGNGSSHLKRPTSIDPMLADRPVVAPTTRAGTKTTTTTTTTTTSEIHGTRFLFFPFAYGLDVPPCSST
jgi:hypothetical protein